MAVPSVSESRANRSASTRGLARVGQARDQTVQLHTHTSSRPCKRIAWNLSSGCYGLSWRVNPVGSGPPPRQLVNSFSAGRVPPLARLSIAISIILIPPILLNFNSAPQFAPRQCKRRARRSYKPCHHLNPSNLHHSTAAIMAEDDDRLKPYTAFLEKKKGVLDKAKAHKGQKPSPSMKCSRWELSLQFSTIVHVLPAKTL